jgi:hypothetical protein
MGKVSERQLCIDVEKYMQELNVIFIFRPVARVEVSCAPARTAVSKGRNNGWQDIRQNKKIRDLKI